MPVPKLELRAVENKPTLRRALLRMGPCQPEGFDAAAVDAEMSAGMAYYYPTRDWEYVESCGNRWTDSPFILDACQAIIRIL